MHLKRLSAQQFFMGSMLVVNIGNYTYNLILGRLLTPAAFADAAILITLLLVLSFLGMTFQIVTSKYAVLYHSVKLNTVLKLLSRAALLAGFAIGLLIAVFAKTLQQLLKTETHEMFLIFGLSVPLYFLISVNRGLFQGKHQLNAMSVTYQNEMIVRLFVTIFLIALVSIIPSSITIALGILLSCIVGLFPFQKRILKSNKVFSTSEISSREIAIFFSLTAFYELTQIIINNSDILLVKHFFSNDQAGVYASLALIGRVVYFVTWMFVMLLLPEVIEKHKNEEDTAPTLLRYVGYVVMLAAVITSVCFLFPDFVVLLLFGKSYLSIAPLLWKYALATSIFAVANIFAYYFLSTGKFLPVIISALLGLTQIILIVLFHNSLEQVVEMQIISMLVLLFFQLLFYFVNRRKRFV
ncbi:sugar isomerase [Flavobacterium sp.]|uniref:sugar isomerase n=1 Tax=Flavobacterium sp. TaxID=239 RepID=UPI0026392D29|nr:sugar isomerase [Flavobacterium sp.]